MYINAKFLSSPNHGGRQLYKCLIFCLLVAPRPSTKQTFLHHGKLVKKEKKVLKSFLRSHKWLFFSSFLFVLLRFKYHQTLYISARLAHSFNTLLSYSMYKFPSLLVATKIDRRSLIYTTLLSRVTSQYKSWLFPICILVLIKFSEIYFFLEDAYLSVASFAVFYIHLFIKWNRKQYFPCWPLTLS